MGILLIILTKGEKIEIIHMVKRVFDIWKNVSQFVPKRQNKLMIISLKFSLRLKRFILSYFSKLKDNKEFNCFYQKRFW